MRSMPETQGEYDAKGRVSHRIRCAPRARPLRARAPARALPPRARVGVLPLSARRRGRRARGRRAHRCRRRVGAKRVLWVGCAPASPAAAASDARKLPAAVPRAGTRSRAKNPRCEGREHWRASRRWCRWRCLWFQRPRYRTICTCARPASCAAGLRAARPMQPGLHAGSTRRTARSRCEEGQDTRQRPCGACLRSSSPSSPRSLSYASAGPLLARNPWAVLMRASVRVRVGLALKTPGRAWVPAATRQVELFGKISKHRVLPPVVTRKLAHIFTGSSMLTLFYLFPVGHSCASTHAPMREKVHERLRASAFVNASMQPSIAQSVDAMCVLF